MKIVIAPDSFKGSLSSPDAARAIEKGIKRVFPQAECICLPMADGGEGTLAALLHVAVGRRLTRVVTGPAKSKVRAGFGFLKDKNTAVIEMALASGLMLVKKGRRKPLDTTSYGTGELIAAALDKGAGNIIIGVGGSATVDAGAGMLQALGVRYRDVSGKLIRQKACGGMLDRIDGIDMEKIHPGIKNTGFIVAADVDNTLCGKKGAARTFAPQKGATPAEVGILEKNLKHFAAVIKKDLGVDVINRRGAGAAGGMGAGLIAFAGAEIRSGIELVAELIQFEKHLAGADMVITGEGLIDSQTGHGKSVFGIAKISNSLGIPVVAIGGGIDKGIQDLLLTGIDGLVSAVPCVMTLEDACANAKEYVTDATERAMRLIKLGNRLRVVESRK